MVIEKLQLQRYEKYGDAKKGNQQP